MFMCCVYTQSVTQRHTMDDEGAYRRRCLLYNVEAAVEVEAGTGPRAWQAGEH
jgi:hypothetical protein